MTGNFYESHLREVLSEDLKSKCLQELGSSTRFFANLTADYPSNGSKINWPRVPGSIERTEGQETHRLKSFILFFDEIVRSERLSGDVVYVGDSATDFALTGSVDRIRAALPELLAIPQHHYLIGFKPSWCMCFSMEGDMGFGFHPSSSKKQLPDSVSR